VSQSLSSHLLLGHLYSTAVADNSLITDTFILTTVTFVILYRSENPFAEKTVPFWFVCSIVNRFWLQYFSSGGFQNFLRRSEADDNPLEVAFDLLFSFKSHVLGVFFIIS
jgi:hypothetical protein